MATFTSQDHVFMARALRLAKKGLYTTHPNPRVGCVLVKHGEIIGEGWHVKTGNAHAEINALANVNDAEVKGATAYVTLEPCSHRGRTPPCSQALVNAGVKRVVVSMLDPNPLVAGKGLAQLTAAGIEIEQGLLASAAAELNAGFIKRMEQGLPRVSVKLAMSLDGRTAMKSGESKWITGQAARHDVQYLRAKASAILTGQGTVMADNPSLNVRLNKDELAIEDSVRQPMRVVLDPELLMSVDTKMLSLDGRTVIFTSCDDQQKICALKKATAEVCIISQPKESRYLPLRTILQQLAHDYEINDIHVEAGATLCGALLQEGLADELVIYMAPHIMGSAARGLLNLPKLVQMEDRINLKIQDVRAIGDDWRIIARPIYRLVT
jgi:diaminohydroxyphosphoribosylaminopyrimidine deaminase/5-amino-6-(5-phosphoribosylamino)uracil reductase